MKIYFKINAVYLFDIINRAYPVQRAPALCGVWGRVSVATLPSLVQCEETVTRTWDLLVTGGKTLPLAPGLHDVYVSKLFMPFQRWSKLQSSTR